MQIIQVLLVIGMQLAAAHFTGDLIQQVTSLEYGNESAALAFLSVGFSFASGALLTYSLFKNQVEFEKTKAGWISVIILAAIPLAGIILLISLAAFGPGVFPFSFLRPGWSELYEWVLYSQVPALWLGLVSGRLLLAFSLRQRARPDNRVL